MTQLIVSFILFQILYAACIHCIYHCPKPGVDIVLRRLLHIYQAGFGRGTWRGLVRLCVHCYETAGLLLTQYIIGEISVKGIPSI